MELIKEHWSKNDVTEFQKYLKSLENKEKQKWTKNIINTLMPVLAIKTPVIKQIVNEIAKGNFLEFLDLMIWKYYENTAINGFLICKIKDFNLMKKYLKIYSKKVDNWASCDLLKFNTKNHEQEYYNMALEFMNNIMTFTRRIGVNILFNFISNSDYISKIFDALNTFQNETEYYVNMVNAWLLCECYIKQKALTIAYLEHNKLNNFTINKAIQKCRDSFRVTPADKQFLLKFKR